jgi:uncharacterized RmlC-like cupin family protein
VPSDDAFHPDFTTTSHTPPRNRVHHVSSTDLDSGTAQTEGMRRFAAINGGSAGAEKLWMGETHVAPSTASANHHHGQSETAIYVCSRNPEFVFHDGEGEVGISTKPGDYVFVPPYLPHREENPDAEKPAEIVIARSTQQAVVVNLPRLYAI